MADYTATQDGNWNDDATWGGSGHPSANGDTATIAYKVAYNAGDSAIEWNNITINSGGMLYFPTDANSTIKFDATAVLTINNGGEIRTGTDLVVNYIDKAYKLKMLWAQGSTSRNVYVLHDGGIINIEGDEQFYSATKKLTLESEWDAAAGDTLYVEGDQTSTWPVGMYFYLNKGYNTGEYALSTSFQTDGDTFEIASIGAYDSGNDRTPITVTSGHSSPLIIKAGQELLSISRNVELGDPGCSFEVYSYNTYSEYIRFDNNQTETNRLINYRDCMFFGWDRAFYGGYNIICDNLTFISNSTCFYVNNNIKVTADCVSCLYFTSDGSMGDFQGTIVATYYPFRYLNLGKVSGFFISNAYTFYNVRNLEVSGEIISCNMAFYLAENNNFSGIIRNNRYACYQGFLNKISAEIYDNDNEFEISFLRDGKMVNLILQNCLLNGTDFKEFRTYYNCGEIISITSTDSSYWVEPKSKVNLELLVTPNSYCKDSDIVSRLPFFEHPAIVTADEKKMINVAIYPVGYTTPLTNSDVWIEVEYFDTANSPNVVTLTSKTDSLIFQNDMWFNIPITFTPGQSGMVKVRCYISKYESGAYILVDPGSGV